MKISDVDDVLAEVPKPDMAVESPAPGKFVKQVAPEYSDSGVYHALYLPTNWTASNKYPVIVEYPCNKYQAFTGKVEDANLGYYLSGGQDYIWIVMPVIQDNTNLDYGFGEQATTANYLKTNLRRVLNTYGGDPGEVIITGFSRGAIGCNYYGTYDDIVADIWLGFLPYAHMDVGTLIGDPVSAKARVEKTNNRSTFVIYGSLDLKGKTNSQTGYQWLNEFGYPVVDCEIPNMDHTDVWSKYDNTSRQSARQWLKDVRTNHPGLLNISGRVTDLSGTGISDVLMETGPTHFTYTNDNGYYTLKNLVNGLHTISITKAGFTFSSQNVTLSGVDVASINFAADLDL